MNQFDVCTHLSNLANLHHDKLIYFGVPLFVIPHLGSRPTVKMVGKIGGMRSIGLTRFPRVEAVVQVEGGDISITAKGSSIAGLHESYSRFTEWMVTAQNRTWERP